MTGKQGKSATPGPTGGLQADQRARGLRPGSRLPSKAPSLLQSADTPLAAPLG